MKFRLIYIAPLKAGVVLACIYLALGLLVSPMLLVAGLAGPEFIGGKTFSQLVHAIMMAVAGAFVAGLVFAIIYNFVSKMIGGLAIELKTEQEESS